MNHIIDEFAGTVIGVEAESPAEMEQIINTYTLPTRWTVIPRGGHLIIVGDDGGSIFTAEYQAILNYATTQGYTLPSATNQNAQNTLVASLKDAGIWTELDVFYNFLTDGDANFAKINWKNPGTFQAVGTGHEPVFTSLTGFSFNGTTQYLDTQFISGPKGTQNNCSIFSDAFGFTEPTVVLFGAFDSVSAWISQLIVNNNRFNYAVNNPSAASFDTGVTAREGFQHGQRPDSANTKLFLNGSQIHTGARTSGPATSKSFFVGARNGTTITFGGASSTRMCGIGSSLVEKELTLYNAWAAYSNPIRATVAYQAIINRATVLTYGLPSANCQTKGRQYILDLMNAGIWDQLDVLYVTATDGSKEFARLNWKSPTLLELVEVNAPPFISKKGFAPAVNSYLNTNYRPATEGVFLTQNDHSAFYGIANSVPAFGADDWGVSLAGGNSGLFADIRTPAGNIDFRCIQSVGNTPVVNPDTLGFYSQKRTASNACALFKNGTLMASGTTASAAKPNLPVFIGCLNLNGVPSNFTNSKQFSVWGAGASLNGKEAANYNAWTAYFNGIQ